MEARVKNRSRFDIKYFWLSGASLRWQSVPNRSLTQAEMVEKLREIADTIEQHGGPTDPAQSAKEGRREMSEKYPPQGCTGRVNCKACPKAGFTFKCRKCKRNRPWCYGHGGEKPSWCDGCWYKWHRSRETRKQEASTR